jgi:8-oxo-dGTP diphosphatase
MTEVEQTFGNKVRIRVCGLCFEGDKILLVKHNMGEYKLWSPPGGGVLFGESIHDTLKREFLEETNLSVEVGDLITLHEHIIKPFHAIELFFNIPKWHGKLSPGNEPELSQNIIEEVKFFDSQELQILNSDELHPIIKNCINPRDILVKKRKLDL